MLLASGEKIIAPYGDPKLLSQAVFAAGSAEFRREFLGSISELFPAEWRNRRAPCDETRLEARGGHSPYQRFAALAGFDPLHPDPARSKAFLLNPMGDQISILPTPLILSAAELDGIRRGTAQQIKALTKLFADLVLSADGRGNSNGIVPPEIIHLILKETEIQSLARLRRIWRGRTESDITFLGSGDLVRAPDGKWYALEFNVGPLGGLADSRAIQEFFLRSLKPETVDAVATAFQLKSDDLLEIVSQWSNSGARRGATLAADDPYGGKSITTLHRSLEELRTFAGNKFLPDDIESLRLREFLSEMGVEICTDDVRIKSATPAAPVAWFDSHDGVPIPKFRTGAVLPLNPPGVDDLLGNKLLLPYLNDLVRHYCKEEPLIPALPTAIVSIRGRTDDSNFSLETFPFDKDSRWIAIRPSDCAVLKHTHSNQGEDVYPFLPETHAVLSEIFTNVGYELEHNRILGHPFRELYVVQPFVDISRLTGHLVDIRPIGVSLGCGDSFVSELPWGRAVAPKAASSTEGRRFDLIDSLKLNVSATALELPVFKEI